MTGEPDDGAVEAIAAELAACRQRGIERLDVSSHNQTAVLIPVLQRLAGEYVMVRQLHAHGRIQQLKFLFRDAIKAFAVENEGDALLVGDLFFGDSLNRVTKSAGELLDLARRKSDYPTEALFREVRRAAFAEFARFLPDFVEDANLGDTRKARSGAAASGSVSVLPDLTTPAYEESAPDPEAPEIRDLEEQTRQTWSGLEQSEVVLIGLSGLQYREFFSILLPYYESVGVAEAANHLTIIRADENARQAVARLADLYHDESVMESILLEL